MNEIPNKIEIFKPFGEAFELTKKILFQPFNIGKWFVIGFAAFLASFSSGTNFNFNPRGLHNADWRSTWTTHSIPNAGAESGAWPVWVFPLIGIGVVLFIAFVLVLVWLGARGRFIFTDCIVRDRGAIAEPWREYHAEGNSFFFFSLIVGLIGLALVILAALPIVLPALAHHDESPSPGAIFGIVILVTIIVLFAFAWTLISQLMVPIMYRQRCRAGAAFRQATALITKNGGPFILYFLFYIVLIVAVAIIGCASVCLTCCITAIPYVGTVILLPIHVLLQSFTLLFVRQFGRDYDVWANITAPEPPQPPPSLPPEPLPIT